MQPMQPPRRSWKERDGNMAHTSSCDWESLVCSCDFRWRPPFWFRSRPVEERRDSMSILSVRLSVKVENILMLLLFGFTVSFC